MGSQRPFVFSLSAVLGEQALLRWGGRVASPLCVALLLETRWNWPVFVSVGGFIRLTLLFIHRRMEGLPHSSTPVRSSGDTVGRSSFGLVGSTSQEGSWASPDQKARGAECKFPGPPRQKAAVMVLPSRNTVTIGLRFFVDLCASGVSIVGLVPPISP